MLSLGSSAIEKKDYSPSLPTVKVKLSCGAIVGARCGRSKQLAIWHVPSTTAHPNIETSSHLLFPITFSAGLDGADTMA